MLAASDKNSSNKSGFSEDISSTLPNIAEESELRSNVSALDLDPALRAKMLQRHSSLNARKSLTYDTPQVFYNGNDNLQHFLLKHLGTFFFENYVLR